MTFLNICSISAPVQRWREDAVCTITDDQGNIYSNAIGKTDTGSLSDRTLPFKSPVWFDQNGNPIYLEISEIRIRTNKIVFILLDGKSIPLGLRVDQSAIKINDGYVHYYPSLALMFPIGNLEKIQNE